MEIGAIEDVYALHAVPASVVLALFFLMLSIVGPNLDDHGPDYFDAAMIEEDQRQQAANDACSRRALELCGGEDSTYRPGRQGKTQCLDKHGRPTVQIRMS